MSDWKPGDTAWVFGYDAAHECVIQSVGYPYTSAVFSDSRTGLPFNVERDRVYASEKDCLEFELKLRRSKMEECQSDLNAAEKAYAAWQAQQGEETNAT